MSSEQERTEVYSLWLMPRGHVADELQTLIADLTRKHMTPSFQPHVTLIGSLNLPKAVAVSKTKELATQIKPFIVKLSEVAYLDQYFRCVFIKAERTTGLMTAHLTARDLFDYQQDEDYMPHLSLVYGDLQSITKRAIIQRIGVEMNIEFLAVELYLYYTGGQPKEWCCVLKAPLQF
ncbi:hypothetical protein AMJ74_02775 [candidate division WOR_3 bacterium SM1_77]|uniref:Cyclic phosphodiesterase-like protein n=1 Tax=candidate division WOR_3 bacterium SM1_77 TaxID=1703778 RepID=A0A0S8JZN9_UNCW3|nr:MAG: hypothetical protein AMJ74_02775 [candidate division WOR_3 bacterium SM1_77]